MNFPMDDDRSRWRNRFHDHGFASDRLRRPRAGRLLHCGNHALTDATIVHRDDLVRADVVGHAIGADLIEDYAFADAGAGHFHNVIDRDSSTELSLACVPCVMLVRTVLLNLLVLRFAQQSAGDGADCSADQRAFGRLIILMTDDAAQNGSCQSTDGSILFAVRLREGGRTPCEYGQYADQSSLGHP